MANKKKHEPFKFADLFAGIGGMRFAFEAAGGECVLTSEINSAARITYDMQSWASRSLDHIYVDDVVELGDMQKSKIPAFDVLVAGFPCQPYSIAGLRQGLKDEKGRGQVFLSIIEILKKVRPKVFLLENVRGMLSHDDGETIKFMISELERLGQKKSVYKVLAPTVLNSMIHGGVPQNRERVFIVGFRNDVDPSSFSWPDAIPVENSLKSVLEKSGVPEKYYYTAAKYDCYSEIKKSVKSKNTAYQWRRTYVRENKSGVCPALTANMGSGGHNVPLVLVNDGIRKLTPLECARLQGFDKYNFKIPSNLADSSLYHQFGNSVTVPLIQKLAEQIALCLDDQ
jgi:DNA (cytosine-5)-methyltransferase 1